MLLLERNISGNALLGVFFLENEKCVLLIQCFSLVRQLIEYSIALVLVLFLDVLCFDIWIIDE